MEWLELKRDEAETRFEQYCETNEFTYDPEYEELRKALCMLFDATLLALKITDKQISEKNNAYQVDLLFGLSLYDLLNAKYEMNVRLAATEGIWRYLSVCVVPDLVERRYGKEHPDRFWKKPRRIWLRVLWWYIHLSWQGSFSSTKEILKENTTDEILQLVDRCGRGGYRVDLYRELMRKNAELNKTVPKSQQLFRKIMVLNTARVQVIEPALTLGGNRGYVDSLSDYFTDRMKPHGNR